MRKAGLICLRELRQMARRPEAIAIQLAFAGLGAWASLASWPDLFALQLGSPSFVLVAAAPWLAGRAIASERADGTLELLASLPVRDWELVVGKFAAAWAWLSAGVAWTLGRPLRQVVRGELAVDAGLGGLAALLLLAAALAALGVCCAALAASARAATVAALGLGLSLYGALWAAPHLPGAVVPWLEYLSLSYHQVHLARGEVDTRDLVYYLTLTVGALAVAVSAVYREPRTV